MTKWTTTPEEYDATRQIMLEMVGTSLVLLMMKDGTFQRGRVRATKIANDAGENLQRGMGRRVTSITGEITLQMQDGSMTTIQAVEVKAWEILPEQMN